MADQKVTTMVLKVDLQCRSCCKKIKKILAKFPQIQSQTYDEKANTVTITVVCCSPEMFRDKLCCKGRKVIKSIEIKPPPKPPKKDVPPPKKDEPPPKKDTPPKKDDPPPKKDDPPPKKDPPPAPPTCIPVQGYLPMYLVPACDRPVPPCDHPIPPCDHSVRACDRRFRACDRPCYCGCDVPAPAYDRCGCGCGGTRGCGCGCGGTRGCGCGCGGTRGCNVSRCDNYFSEENATGCTII